MNKLKTAERVLDWKIGDMESEQEFVAEAPNKFIGKALEDEVSRWTKNVEESQVIIEALKDYIIKLEKENGN